MKNAKILKLLALALVVCMAATLFVGCGGTGTTSSQPTSEDEDMFVAGDDLQIDVSVDSKDDGNSTVSNSGSSSNSSIGNASISTGKDNTISATIREDAKDIGGGLMLTDNDEVFKKIPANLKGKTVLFADWGEAVGEYKKVVDNFTKETGIKCKVLLFSNTDGGYVSRVVQQIAAGSPPDIAASNSTFPQALEMVQPLPSYFNVNDGFWDPRVSEATKIGNKYYFVNSYNSPFTGGYVVYYNKKIYNNNGLLSPEDYYKKGQWSYENLYKCMEDATRYNYKGGILESMTLAEQMGVSLINYDQKTGTFSGKADSRQMVKALQYMATAVDKKLAGGYSIPDFASGQIGICMAGTYGTKADGYFKDLSPSDIGVVPLPNSYEGKQLTYQPLGYRGYGICKGAQNGEAAYYFLRYYLDLQKYDKAGANIFANKVLEKYFRQTQLPLFQKSPLYFEYFQNALQMIDKRWDGPDWTAVRHAPSNQITIELSKMNNICETAAKTATNKLKEYTSKQK